MIESLAMRFGIRRAALFFSLGLAGCVTVVQAPPAPAGAPGFRRLASSEIPAFADDLPPAGLEPAIRRSLDYLAGLDPKKTLQFADRKLTPAEASEGLRRFLSLYKEARSPEELRHGLAKDFQVYESLGPDGKGAAMFTAYYEPTVEARLAPDARFRYPLYRKPADLVEADLEVLNPKLQGEKVWGKVQDGKLVPYLSREQIDYDGALKGRGLELVWVDNAWDAITIHIEGSSRLSLPDGSTRRAKFAASNGLPFKSPGMALVEMGRFKKNELNAAKVRQYLLDHPEIEKTVFTRDPRYTFFSLEDAKDGPIGTVGQPLVAERSIAVDAHQTPLGLLAYFELPLPDADADGKPLPDRKGSRFVLCQDTGGAIQGPGRVDIFMGDGPRAKSIAGRVLTPGRLFIVLPNPKPSPSGR